MLRRYAVLTCLMLFMGAAYAVAQEPVPPPNWDDLGINLVNALIPIIVPIVIWGGRLAAPKLPRFWIPLIAMGLGVLGDWLASLVGGGGFSPLIGALLGAAGVWLREFVNTLQEHGAG